MSEFPKSFPEDRLLATVHRAADFAEKLVPPEETTLVYDDMGAHFPAEFGRGGEPEMGISRADVGEVWGYRAWMAHGAGKPAPREHGCPRM